MKTKIETEEEKKNREMIETIASNIHALAKAVSSLLNGPVKKQALIVLLAQSSGQPQNRVVEVLKALENLEKDWLK